MQINTENSLSISQMRTRRNCIHDHERDNERDEAVRLLQSCDVLERVPIVEPAQLVSDGSSDDQDERQRANADESGSRRR